MLFRSAGLAVGVLREAFDRDRDRVELERQRFEEERLRAERSLRLELLRQAGEREIARLRLVAGLSVGCVLATLLVVMRMAPSATLARVAVGLGCALLLCAYAAAANGQAAVARHLGQSDDRMSLSALRDAPGAGAAPWLVAAGLALVTLGVLLA